MAAYQNRYWSSADGLKLHARDYPGPIERPPVLCLPGLTRNARDYDAFAARLAGRWRVVAVDFRGRGESAYTKDPMSYVPRTYVSDVRALLEALGIERFVAVGTSLGGVVAMLLAGVEADRVAGALINDVGPEVEPGGIGRIRGQIGRSSAYPTWMHAARAAQEAYADAYPDWGVEDWLALAKRLYRLTSAGRIVLDYDQRIAEPFRVAPTEPAADLWAALSHLRDVPTLVVRGARSDVLSATVAERMVAVLDRGELATVPGVGHSPTLAEPAAVAGIERLLERVAR